MIWLTWRQFRAQALTSLAVLVVFAAGLLALGLMIRSGYDADVAGCVAPGCDPEEALDTFRDRMFTPVLLVGFLLLLVPGLIGAFWGAPLIARELETGTHRMVWNQSVTRTRWLAVKLGLPAVTAIVCTGALSLVLGWAVDPFDDVNGGRFDALLFPARDLVPLGYAAFAFVLGATLGLLTRRTLPAMALTMAVFVVLQVVVPVAVREHLMPAETTSVAYNRGSAQTARLNLKHNGDTLIEGYALPGAWVLSGRTPLVDASGTKLTPEQVQPCLRGKPAEDAACLERLGARFEVSYQPGSRYWPFQWLETALYLLLAGLVAVVAFARIRRG
ncbi:ABC transporter permease subunit [Dactylosporangium sucinum]|uniref:Transporter n=1 Tax=Dactylosporangium sucinum TaxID=1424081 RepID=A0A917TY04_9ACTN|nr:ABC transporter permease subunit [Dactylosporangium sucinum]GGM44119.1 transporter [Dactylosporangium sucinum]